MDPLVLAAVAVAGSLFGVWISHQFQTRREDRRWRHDQKLRAYRTFGSAVNQYGLLTIWLREPKAAGSLKEATDLYLSWLDSLSGIELLGSEETVAIAQIINKKLGDYARMFNEAVNKGAPLTDLKYPDLKEEDLNFIAAARRDLGLPKIPAPIFRRFSGEDQPQIEPSTG